jgi:polyphosphate kinase
LSIGIVGQCAGGRQIPSWANRAGVERVMEFCSADQLADFLRGPPNSKASWRDGIHLFKLYLDIGRQM